ncbi:MAG: universal stress protein [gamma proteobacterium endosymbiont of Lamellibrachia anaximandri]|nr:universal stress protein [gamma proteobacterium endosymbiont of Lamellibrachia anaximandri]MBL3535723.1 universal stress protein [gamma proteobacterium endosymbiont of Lamellibrachia anaximandri]
MEGYRNILCAIDFSPYSEAAVERAVALTRSTGAQLTLLHVVEFFPEDRSNEQIAPEDTDPVKYRMSRARAKLAEQARFLGEIEAAQEVVVSEHSAKYEIVRFGEERKMDLIVVASHGLHGISALLGSTADGVLHTASCDVLVARSGA